MHTHTHTHTTTYNTVVYTHLAHLAHLLRLLEAALEVGELPLAPRLVRRGRQHHLELQVVDVPERGRLIEGAGLRLAPEEVVDLVGEARDLLDDLVQDL